MNKKDIKEKEETKEFIQIPKDNSKLKIFSAIGIIILLIFGIIIFNLKDVIFPKPKISNPDTPNKSPTDLKIEFDSKYTLEKYNDFDSEKENTYWLAKNYLKSLISKKLKTISENYITFYIEFDGNNETNNNHNSNINFNIKSKTFEYLDLKSFNFRYKIISKKNLFDPRSLTFNYQKELKFFISVDKLIEKLPDFNQKIDLPSDIIIGNDNFDSEIKSTHFLAKNTLFTEIENYYQAKNILFSKLKSYYQKETLKINDKDELQSYYKVELIGSFEKDENSNNTNITWELENNLNFTTLTITKFTFQINVKVRNKIVKNNFPITYQEKINLIISLEKLKNKIDG